MTDALEEDALLEEIAAIAAALIAKEIHKTTDAKGNLMSYDNDSSPLRMPRGSDDARFYDVL